MTRRTFVQTLAGVLTWFGLGRPLEAKSGHIVGQLTEADIAKWDQDHGVWRVFPAAGLRMRYESGKWFKARHNYPFTVESGAA